MIDEPSGAKCLYIYISKFGIEIAFIFDSLKKKCLYILLGNYINHIRVVQSANSLSQTN